MGNTSSFGIPISRSHLHFEIGLRLSENFQVWYDRKNFNTSNQHGNFNGYNLVGTDPLKFFKFHQTGNMKNPLDYFNQLNETVRVRIKSKSPPSILEINPSLNRTRISREFIVRSWICSFGPHGIPLSFEPSQEGGKQNIEILSYTPSKNAGYCRKLVNQKNSSLTASEQLVAYIEILFAR